MTPRQIVAVLHFIKEQSKREAALNLSLHALASQGSAKDIKEQMKELEK